MAGSCLRAVAGSKTFGFIAAGVALALAVGLFVAVQMASVRSGPSFIAGKAAVATPRELAAPAVRLLESPTDAVGPYAPGAPTDDIPGASTFRDLQRVPA